MKADLYLTPGRIADAVPEAERARRLGFSGLFTADTAHEPFLPIAAAATAVSGLDYGTAIAVAFARSPMVVAQTAWDLAELTEGRFILGLGTQIKPHITRRFSMPWSAPVERLREYIAALRAIWNSWQEGSPLRFGGDTYRFTLMTPFFNPGPIEQPDVPVFIAGVGPRMASLAGEVAAGYHVHPFHTVKYLDRVTLPAITAGAERTGRRAEDVALASTVFVVTGHNDEEMAAMRAVVRQQISFYASTPAYRPVLDVHGWDFGEQLTVLSKRGEWDAMAAAVPDAVVEEMAVVAPIESLGAAIRARYGSRLARVGLYSLGPALDSVTDDEWSRLVVDLDA